MDAKSTQVIPAPRAGDGEDVRWALSTATALWTRHEWEDALRWLRRASDAANDINDDLRAIELLYAAAEIATTIKAVSLPDRGPGRPRPPPLPQRTHSPLPLPPPARSSLRPLPPTLPPPPRLPTSSASPRVAVRIIDGVAHLQPIGPDMPRPPGAAMALLVPLTERDADVLSTWARALERARSRKHVKSVPPAVAAKRVSEANGEIARDLNA